MKTLLCALLLMFSTVVQAGAGSTHGTATVIEKGEWELGLYAPLRADLAMISNFRFIR